MFIRLKEVLRQVPISRSSVWRLAKLGKFPRPVRLTDRCTAWKQEEIQAWLASKETASHAQ
jgi:prophage regulatory protein